MEQYQHKEYPKFRHHPQKESVRVEDPDDEAKRTPSSKGWTDSKAEALEKAEKAADAPKKGDAKQDEGK